MLHRKCVNKYALLCFPLSCKYFAIVGKHIGKIISNVTKHTTMGGRKEKSPTIATKEEIHSIDK